jgi:IS30 family transposase
MPKDEPWSKLEKRRVAGYLRKGWSSGMIAEALGRTRSAIMGLVHREPKLQEAMAQKLAREKADPAGQSVRRRRKKKRHSVVIVANIQTPTLEIVPAPCASLRCPTAQGRVR